jgi:hypothetical protein
MSYSLKQAAEATGKTKTTILRAIQTNKLSATKDVMGAWQIDPAELHRVYKAVGDADVRQTQRSASELYERLLAEKDRQITSLTEQLKAADEERRTTLRQLTALLTDQRAKQQPMPDVIAMSPPSASAEEPAPAPVPAKEIGWLRRMMGGK